MELKELLAKRKKRIKKYVSDKDVIYKEFQKELKAIDAQIEGQKKLFVNKRASTVKQVLNETRTSKRTKISYDWNKVNVQKLSKDKKKPLAITPIPTKTQGD